ncbi:hypothetical protein [Crystallibacter degradans]|uniref:hypothetical protein n=1 Tax=Crystallibacter degradans TaxID=2726743 RepID=UPI001475EF13|nr:hypothetical protein [Arthrobacter sp. SF27]NMR28152.1 hypothetical protein [Arthrobacter sp. SF27]
MASDTSRRNSAALWRRLTAVLLLVLSLLSVPALAHAAFTGHASGSLSVGAAKLIAPSASATSVTATCNRYQQGSRQLIITAGNYGKVNHATSYEFIVKAPGGMVAHTGDPATSSGRQYSQVGDKNGLSGTWTWELRGKYPVPGSTNVWTGQPLAGQLNIVCN